MIQKKITLKIIANELEINPTLTLKQKECLRLLTDHKNNVTEILYGGAAGGGKSFLGCLWIITCCTMYPESRWLIGRAKLSTLKKTTLKTFFEVTKYLGLKEGIDYKYNSVSNEIKFYNGSEVILKDLFAYPSDSEYESLSSLEIAGAFLDEVSQISEKAKNIVMSRIRHKLDVFGISPKILMTCNPSKNWTYNEFYKKNLDGTIEDYKKFIQALISDNPFISKFYVQGLERQDSITRERLLSGNWSYSESELSLFNYDSIIDMFDDDDISSSGQTYLSIDVARLGKDKTVIIVWNDLEVVEIKELSKQELPEQIDIINNLKAKYKVTNNQYLVFDVDGVGGFLKDSFKSSNEIINNSRPLNGENYQNLKAQLYFKLSEVVNAGLIKIHNVKIDVRTRLTQELMVIKREGADQDGKLKITSKDQIKQLIGRSPDISDAMAFRMLWMFKKAYTPIVFM